MLLSLASVAWGIYGGVSLWRVRPRAVHIAKLALLFGLAVDIVTTAIETAALQTLTDTDGPLLWHIELDALPSLVFFTACYAYLVGSDRVRATYGVR